MTEDERSLDLLVGELEHENRLVRARNERLEQACTTIIAERDALRRALEEILTITRAALFLKESK